MDRPKVRVLVVACSLLLTASAAWAQGSNGAIAGAVKDASGALLPGVTVEAASPALIEKVRSSVTDGQGLYRIVDLRPGVYTVTFTLPGFSTFKREGLELTAGFTAAVNADLKVGELAETITVSGESPVVDLQNVRQQTTLSRTTLEALPTTGRISQLVNFIPGAVVGNPVWQSVGGLDERANAFSAHGGRFDDNVPIIDGLAQRLQGGAVFVFNQLAFQEVSVETGGTAADQHDFLILRRRHHHTRGLIAHAAPAFAGHRHGLDRVLRDIEDTGFNLQLVVHAAAVEKDPAVGQQK